MPFNLMKFTLFVMLLCAAWVNAKSINALINEESPYLQQHAYNPVDWMPWGEAAFKKAKDENKLIFLSIGYSTCHWCHVMERESFEDTKVAKLLNRYFISIKVDREEHPQIDRYYQQVYRIMSHRTGGWPLTILLTPDRKPFFAATYIPREGRYKQIGLLELLQRAAKLWEKEPARIKKIGDEITTLMKELNKRVKIEHYIKIKDDLSRRFVQSLEESFDWKHGGWGVMPKFPRANTLIALLKIYRLSKDKRALDMAIKTLTSMARGGVYDQIEGGFFRYSTDSKWHIPHFEKMLYTNAELLEAYAIAARVSGKELYKRVATQIVLVMLRHYRDRSGLFYGASDADSLDPKNDKKEEGFYFTFAYDEALEALKLARISDPKKALRNCGITEDGNLLNFRSNPYLPKGKLCAPNVRKALSKLRTKRPYPFIDKKLQASWNALMIHALFVAAQLNVEYGKLALETLKALKRELYHNNELYHQKLPSHTPKVAGLMEDYSFTIAATLDAYEWNGDDRWLKWASRLYNEAKKRFYERGVWFDAQGEFRNPLSLEDGSYRSPLALLADDLLRLAALKESLFYQEDARKILRSQSQILAAYPQASTFGLLAWLADRYGYVVAKTPKDSFKALRNRIYHECSYPFLLVKPTNDIIYQACRIDRCFLYDRNRDRFLEKLIKKLKIKP